MAAESAQRRQGIRHPERIIPLAFLVGIAVGTALLMLPLAHARGDGVVGASFITALFTATSAFCVTGMTVVDTAQYWSTFGHVVLLALTQVGGFGIMTGTTLLGLLVTGRNRLSGRLLAQAEMRSLDLGDVAAVVRLVLIVTISIEGVLALLLTLRLHFGVGMSWGASLWNGLFHAVAAFNNAGFTILPTGLMPYAADGWLLSPMMLGVILGGIGFPVMLELRREWRRPGAWSVHTKLTLFGTLGLLLTGCVATLMFEWNNAHTLGAVDKPGRLLGAMFHSVMTRSGGMNIFDVGEMHPESLILSTGLMLVGGGSASTAGGIKVTTFLLLGCVVWAEIRGTPDTVAFRRRIAPAVQRQALAIVLLAIGIVWLAVLALVAATHLPLDRLLFEVVSAFGNVGLSTGLAAEMPAFGQLILTILMYMGRVGTVSIATALALRVRHVPWRYPVERPIVG